MHPTTSNSTTKNVLASSSEGRRIRTVTQHLTTNPVAAQSSSSTIGRSLFHPPKTACLAEYDYIVVGGGSAGCALAARLAEKAPLKTVLLVDAGGDCRQFRIESPFITCAGLQNSDVDFAYRTNPQAMQQNRLSHWPRGRVLGGCSSNNYMLAVRCDARGYDKWANEMGCAGWAFKDIEKYFTRLEDYRSTRQLNHRGRHGAVTITDNRDMQYQTKPTIQAFVKGCEELGVPEVDDYNAPYLAACAAESQTTIRDGKRCNTAKAYLFAPEGAFNTCPNLSCLTDEQVARITFDLNGELPRANGIELISGPRIRARMEVILSAGAVGSPQILLLSGVGPRAHLESKNIKVVADLPGVGQNLKDHLMVGNVYETKDNWVGNFNPLSPIQLFKGLSRLMLFNDGLFVSVLFCDSEYELTIVAVIIKTTSWVQGMAFFDAKDGLQKPTDAHAIQIHVVPMVPGESEESIRNIGIDPKIHEAGTKRPVHPVGVLFLPSLLQPKSSGYIELKSSNPRDHPIIEPRYLSHEDDIKVMSQAWKFVDDVCQTKAMKDVIKGPVEDDSITKKGMPFGSEEYRIAKIKRDVVTIYHPTSTCKMGPDSDPMSVLDPKTLSVRKVTNLRVADCSAFPDIPAGNTNLPAIMIGERAADLIAFGPIQ